MSERASVLLKACPPKHTGHAHFAQASKSFGGIGEARASRRDPAHESLSPLLGGTNGTLM